MPPIPFTFGNALDFDGVNDSVAMATGIAVASSRTLNFWFKLDAFGKVVFHAGSGSPYIQVNSTAINVTTTQVKSYTVPSLSLSTWYMCTVVFETTTAKVYLNGTESTSLSQGLPFVGSYTKFGGGYGGFHYNGVLDEISWYESELTPTQIANLYNAGTGNFANIDVAPLVWFKLNESGTATTAVNSGSGGSTYDGTLNNFPTSGMWVDHYTGLPFAFNNTLQFDGVNDFVSFNSGINLTSAFTFSTWLKPSVFSLQALFANSSYSQGYIAIMNSTTLRFNSAGGGSSNFTVPTMVAGEWCHIAITRDASNNVKLYFNGVATQTYVNTGTAFIDSISNYNSGQFRTSVAIDEVGILTGTDATLTQIASLYNSGAGENFTSVMGSSDLNYHLDESGTATTAVDSSGNGND